MSTKGRHASAGRSDHISHGESIRRAQIDAPARGRARQLPAWCTTQLDHALATGLVRDADLPTTADEITDIVSDYGWTLAPLAQLVGAGFLHSGEVQLMSWKGRAFVARLALDAGPDLANRIQELREAVAA